jgi:hypothetical protein
MKNLTHKIKIAGAQIGLLVSLGALTGLFAASAATAHPTKYRDTQVNPILVLAATDDFRAPPSELRLKTPTTSVAITEDFRAPPADLIETGSTEKPINCSRVTYKTCARRH